MRQSDDLGLFSDCGNEQTNKIGRTYISAKALSMDIRTSAVYLRGKYSDVSKSVKPSRSKVKQIYGNKCVPFD